MLTWPHAHGDWATSLFEVEQVCLELARIITRQEKLLIVAWDGNHQRYLQESLHNAGLDFKQLVFAIHPSNDSWTRDHGPISVFDGDQPHLLDFRFNGWGNKYPHELDDSITRGLHTQGVFDAVPLEPVDLVLEGGSIETDGAGTLLTTTSCLLHEARNPELDRAALERRLGELFGLQRILWLEHGWLAGDDTDGHIDMLARFCDAGTIACTVCDDPDDEHYVPLRAMREELAALRTLDERPYRLLELPIPAPILDPRGQRLPASYTNFLIINGMVLVPLYADPNDAIAITRLASAFSQHEVIGIDCRPLIRQYGSLHCLTMQLPRGVLR